MTEDIAITSPSGAPEADAAVSLPNPVHHEQPNPEAGDKPEALADKAAPEKKPSIRDAIDKASAKVAQSEKDGTIVDKTKPVVTEGTQRDDKGKFSPKAGDAPKADAAAPIKTEGTETGKSATHNIAEPPARFSADAKAVWATAPDPVKHETYRAIRNLEAGIKEHADNYAPFKEFHDLARQVKVDPAKALQEYVTIDKMLGENFPAAIERIFANKRADLRTFAADVLKLSPEARQQLQIGAPQRQAQPVNPEVLELRSKVARLEQQIGGVAGTIESQQQQAVTAEITQFKADKPLFDELSGEIAQHIANNGLSLPEAYARAFEEAQDKARRLGFITPPPVSQQSSVDDLEAQRLRGRKSIAGAPSAGSSPATQKPSSSIKDAIRRAAQAVG